MITWGPGLAWGWPWALTDLVNEEEGEAMKQLIGWEEIAGVFNMNPEGFRKKHGRELIQSGVVVHARRIPRRGPPRRIVCSYYRKLTDWTKDKMKRGEPI